MDFRLLAKCLLWLGFVTGSFATQVCDTDNCVGNKGQHGLVRIRPPNHEPEVNRLNRYGAIVEHSIHSQCSQITNSTTIHFAQVGKQLPTRCSILTLCDKRFCMVVQKEAYLFSEEIDSTSSSPVHEDFVTYFTRADLDATLARRDYTYHQKNFTTTDIRDVFSANLINRETMMTDIASILRTYQSVCDTDDRTLPHDILIRVHNVPFGCGYIKICNTTKCVLYTHMAKQLASVFDYTKGRYVLGRHAGVTFCAAEQVARSTRKKRRAKDLKLITTKLQSILNFNLPGYFYCGPGTKVSMQDDAGGPVNDVDAACRQHDVDYMLGVTPAIADSKLLQTLSEIGSPLYPLFSAVFEAKRYFEKLTGQVYTSSLYFVSNDESPSLSQIFYFNSVYDTYNASLAEVIIGKAKEERWRIIVEDIWRGYCYTGKQVPTGGNSGTSASNTQAGQPSAASHSEQLQPTGHPTAPTDESANPPADGSFNLDLYNVPPSQFGGCRIVISEVSTHNAINHKNFIELQKICPSRMRNFFFKLDGFRILILEAGDPPTLLINAVLTDKKLQRVQDEIDGQRQGSTSYYFVLGSDAVGEKDMGIADSLHLVNNIPDGVRSTFAVVLVYAPKDTMGIPFLNNIPANIPYQLQEEDIALLENSLQDVVVYGCPCALDICGVFKRWTPGSRIMPDDNAYIPIDDQPESEEGKPYASISRCTKSLLPIQFNDWQNTEPTPKQKNKCSSPPLEYAFSLRNAKLQSTAQKILVNSYNFFKHASLDPSILQAPPSKLTSLASNVLPRQVRRILERHRIQTVETPGKTRKGTTYVLSRFDTMDLDLIKRIIQEEYSNGRPPYLDIIYRKAMAAFSNNLPNAGGIGRKGCAKNTFRKLLRKMGFRFGRINQRLGVLQRPDIVAWRGRFLKALRDNAAGRKLPLVWTDESWIDVNMRSGKAWIPDPELFPNAEQVKYTYRHHKVSRGPRLIMMHAGTEDGFIHEVMKVYPVGGPQTLLDYHGNVDSKTYYKWFRSLLAAINNTGEHIIVIDNAPYHTATDAPKQNNRKADLIRWIREKDPAGTISGFRVGYPYLKWELWELVKQLKKKVQHYIIDKMAEAEGHTILRLPPYNCDLNPIELVWKDIKQYVRDNNRDQTIQSVKEVVEQRMLTYTAEQWRQHIGHTTRLAEKYWREDGFYDQLMETQNQNNLIVSLENVDDDDDDDDDDLGDFIHSNVHDGEGITIDNNGRIVEEEELHQQRGLDYSARRQLQFPIDEEMQE